MSGEDKPSKKRPGAIRKRPKAAPTKGSGGHGKRALKGKGPTPKAEDRHWYPASARRASERGGPGRGGSHSGASSRSRRGGSRPGSNEPEFIGGRNAVLEALRAGVPAATLLIAARAEPDDRLREILRLASGEGIPALEVPRPELDRIVGRDAVHQGVAIKVPPYEYADPVELLERTISKGLAPLFVALDGVTDPRNLGAIVRSSAAFGAQGVIVPQRRAAGVTASAWKASAGSAARLPVALAANLTATLKEFRKRGVFVVGLEAGGSVPLPGLDLATSPLLIVVGSEGKGISRLVGETCDELVSIPIDAATESLNAGVAASVALSEVSRLRASSSK